MKQCFSQYVAGGVTFIVGETWRLSATKNIGLSKFKEGRVIVFDSPIDDISLSEGEGLEYDKEEFEEEFEDFIFN